MAKGKNQRLKTLKIYEYLKYHSDKNHPRTVSQIIKALNEQGIDCERKTIYADIEALREYGYKIQNIGYKYYLEEQGLNVEQLRFLLDATQSAAFLTKDQTEQICSALTSLAGEHKTELVDNQVIIFEKVKHDNVEVLDTVRLINHAVELDCKVSFKYFSTGLGGKRKWRRNGERYVENPISLVFNDGLYYLICYSEKYNDMVIYRVDRISDMKVEKGKAIIHTDKDGQIYGGNVKDRLTAFGMWNGEVKNVKLLVNNKYIEEMYDKFGRELYVRPVDNEHFTFTEKISVSDVFFGWVASFGTNIKILEPRDVKDKFVEKMKEIYENY
ncbi:MAG: helix-turn-helix transcriptional regulator [Candidatus Coproplasma sp.]